ncbi:lysoplasmalogenase [Octadecabacter sp. CECT 8868]|uniref:lysoplasmalogenase family protein n=1 Tax=Octadecabacter algicola TaxID=2909342 RepID=UPI001F44B9BC|nr:lysoplasmalogenase [Octadecabacter algicola]MCF2905437.1 lysoplasmalogenase [Octadecabacter algicola]
MEILLILGVVSLLSALTYGAHFVHVPVGSVRSGVKIPAVGALAVISLLSQAPIALTLALAFGTLGDLYLSRHGERNFLYGLIAFLIGHLAYVVLLWQLGGGITPLFAEPWRLLVSTALVATAATIVWRLLPHLGAMRGPVLVYSGVIILMGLSALGLPVTWPLSLAIVGALFFIASDAILGFELFVFHGVQRRGAAMLLWALYWGGQSLILLAVLWA